MIISLKNKQTLKVDDFILNVLLERMVGQKIKRKEIKKHQGEFFQLEIYFLDLID